VLQSSKGKVKVVTAFVGALLGLIGDGKKGHAPDAHYQMTKGPAAKIAVRAFAVTVCTQVSPVNINCKPHKDRVRFAPRFWKAGRESSKYYD
jgi:hypothetical protein